jgi:hypothetical protein
MRLQSNGLIEQAILLQSFPYVLTFIDESRLPIGSHHREPKAAAHRGNLDRRGSDTRTGQAIRDCRSGPQCPTTMAAHQLERSLQARI